MAELIRRLLDRALATGGEDLTADLAAIDASFGALHDTDVLIANLRGISAARAWLKGARTSSGRLSISVVTTAEIVGRMRSPERGEVARLLASFRRSV